MSESKTGNVQSQMKNKYKRLTVPKSISSKVKYLKGLQVVFSAHFVERFEERIRPIISSGKFSQEQVQSLLWSGIKKSVSPVGILGRKLRLEVTANGLDLLLVVAPMRKGKGLELVTV